MVKAKIGQQAAREELIDYLERNNLKRVHLARQIGASTGTVGRWLDGETKISNVYLRLIKEAGIFESFMKEKGNNARK